MYFSPLGRLPDSNNETRVRTSALAAYTKAIKQLADKIMVYLSICHELQKMRTYVKIQFISMMLYREAAIEIGKTLVLMTDGLVTSMSKNYEARF